MDCLKEDLNKLFEEIAKLEIEGSFGEASALIDVFLEKSGKPGKWVCPKNKTGSNVDYDIASKILYLIERGSSDGISDDALRIFNHIFLTGTRGRKSPTEALHILQNLSINDPRINILLGNLWECGVAIGKVNIKNAFDQYSYALTHEDSTDGYNYARLLYDGTFKRDYRESLRALSGSKQPLSPDCLNLLGRMFIERKAPWYNPKLAYRCFGLASMSMYCFALTNYALMTFFGLGCKADKAKALKLLKIADFAGSDSALEISHKLESGAIQRFSPALLEKIPSNFSRHLKSLSTRSKEGDIKAMIQLGDIYYSPIVFKCMCGDKALKYFFQAAKAGSLYAAIFLKEVWLYHSSDGLLMTETQECLEHGQFNADPEILVKVNKTDLAYLPPLDERDDEPSRHSYCPAEALYWAIAVKDESTEKYSNDWEEWIDSLKKEANSLRKAIKKIAANL